MLITILTQGSRGDVQPYVALGVGLHRTGFRVRIPAPQVFQQLIEQAGLEFVPMHSLSPQEFIRNPDIQAAARRGGQLGVLMTLMRKAGPLMQQIFEEYWRTSEGADVIISGTLPFGAMDCAEKRAVPGIYAPLHPMQPTGLFPNPFFAPFGIRRNVVYHRLSHLVIRQLLWQMFRRALNRWRRTMQMTPHSLTGYYRWMYDRHIPVFYGFSRSVLPSPDDWPDWHHITGYWFLDEPPSWQPPPELVHFLESGPKPVYIGFGSMDDQNPERITQVVIDALAHSGQRGIVLSGWGNLGNRTLPDTIFRIESIPHSWLFPHVAAVVHHGGAGTTAAGLRAGVPTVITPLVGDQPFWAARVEALGVGVRGPSFFRTTAEQLAAAISRAISDPEIQRRATLIGEAIRAEDGVGCAVEGIIRHLDEQARLKTG